VQTDARLIEYVEHAAQLGADLRGKSDALALAAGERGRGTFEAQVAQPDGQQKLQTVGDFVQNASRQDLLPRSQLDLAGHFLGAHNRQSGKVGNRQVSNLHRQALRAQPPAPAFVARHRRHVLLKPLAIVFRGALAVPTVEQRNDTGKDRRRARVGGISAKQDQVLDLSRELLEGRLQIEAVVLRGAREPATDQVGARPWPQPSGQQGPRPVGNDFGGIEGVLAPQTLTDLAGAICAVKRERSRLEDRDAGTAVGAGEFTRVETLLTVHHCHLDDALGELHGRLDGSCQTTFDAPFEQQPVDDDFDGMVAAPVERDLFVELAQFAVDAGPHEPLLLQLFE